MKARCIDDSGMFRRSPITKGKVYPVIDVISECYNIIDDNGEEWCYSKRRFEEVKEVEKEKVLEVEFQDVFDKVACRIKYQNEEVLKRGEFEDDEINVISVRQPTFRLERLYLRGNNKEKDNFFEIVSKYQEGIIKQKVDAINDKYGIPKRWRANIGERYFYITAQGSITHDFEHNTREDDLRHQYGNYFRTEDDGEVKLEKIRLVFKGE